MPLKSTEDSTELIDFSDSEEGSDEDESKMLVEIFHFTYLRKEDNNLRLKLEDIIFLSSHFFKLLSPPPECA